MEPSQTTLRKIERAPQTLRDIVQERMREAIIDGHFAPGERLVERPLCDQLGVSRTVIRETIRYLEAEGLVEIIPNRGPVVARLTWDQARQIYDVRRQLEAAAAAASAEVQRPEFAADLSRALAEVEASMSDTEWGHLLRATTGFYQLIFLEAGHTIAWDIVQRLNGRISRLRALTIAAKDRETSGMSHMTAIHDAILSRNPEAARRAVETHIADAARTAERFLKEPADEPSNDT
ncbi:MULTISPECIES: GntR family transcriptional regulator [unclassified Phaeobacter]|uniref:GntR family transcriptional regulator n=1 Tax=unclassified Phaeobacter TaxID=2621772 RepID=UPI003A8395E1